MNSIPASAYAGQYDPSCSHCHSIDAVEVRGQFDGEGRVRMTTFTCQACDVISFVQEPAPGSPAGIAKCQRLAA